MKRKEASIKPNANMPSNAVSPELLHGAQATASLRSVWFTVPVAINAVLQLLFQTVVVVYDGGATQTNVLCFSLPYWFGVLLIGVRRWRHPTASDALFCGFGQLASIITLFILPPKSPYQ